MIIRKLNLLTLRILSAATLLCTISAAFAAQSDEAAVVSTSIESVFRPAYAQFDAVTDELSNQTQAYCEQSADSSINELHKLFVGATSAFSAIEMYRLGALTEDNRQHRLFYWPDKRRVGERQLRALLADSTASALTMEALTRKSVALQGLPALERILYQSKSKGVQYGIGSAECHVAVLVAQNIHQMAQSIHSGWQSESDFVNDLLDPGASSTGLRNQQEVLRLIVTQIAVGIDVLRHRKIAPLLEEEATFKAQPFYRSGQVLLNLSENLESLRALTIDSALTKTTDLTNELAFEYTSARTMLNRLQKLPSLTDDRGRVNDDAQSLLHALWAVLGGIENTINERLTSALGVSVSFNSEDGD